LKRRLAAILAADVVGYSAMVQRDEVGAIQTVKGHLSAFEPHIALHHGRIVKKMGDGFLAEFTSVVEAVACAVELQKTATERNQSLRSADQAVFRIGVHAGDIIEDDNDIFGDGVNIASRLEGIAAPGSIAISAKVFEDVDGRLDLAFKDRGLQTLKNIQRPLKVFEIEIGAAAVPQRPQPDLPDKPSIAILPLQTFSGNVDDEFLADGLTEDLTTALSSVPWLFVIARNSAFTYKGLAMDIRRISQELGVKYIVEGSVQRSGNRIRISAQLADATDGKHIWADRYDGQLEDVFDLQDRIVSEVVRAVAPQIQSAEIQKSARKRPDDRTISIARELARPKSSCRKRSESIRTMPVQRPYWHGARRCGSLGSRPASTRHCAKRERASAMRPSKAPSVISRPKLTRGIRLPSTCATSSGAWSWWPMPSSIARALHGPGRRAVSWNLSLGTRIAASSSANARCA
jgi:TolB-like protein